MLVKKGRQFPGSSEEIVKQRCLSNVQREEASAWEKGSRVRLEKGFVRDDVVLLCFLFFLF